MPCNLIHESILAVNNAWLKEYPITLDLPVISLYTLVIYLVNTHPTVDIGIHYFHTMIY